MEITVKQLFSIIRKNLVLIILSAAVCFLGAYGISRFVIPKTYQSTVKMYVSTPTSADGSAADINALNYAQKVVNTYIEMLQTNSFYQKVLNKSGAKIPLEDLQKMVRFSALNDTEVFQATVSSRDPEQAKLLADTVAALAPVTISQMKENASLKVVDPAALPDRPSSPNTLLNSLIGLLLGLAGSLIFAVARDTLDIRIKGEDDILEKYNIPVIASIPAFNNLFAKQSSNHAKRGSR